MKMLKSNKGQTAGGIVAGIVGITIAAILIATVFLPQVMNANQTGWDSATISVWSTVALAAAVGLMVLTFRVFGVI